MLLFENGSLVSSENSWMLWCILAVIVAVSIFLEQRFKWASSLSAPVLAIIIAFVAANTFIIPTSAPVYDSIGTYCIPLAMAMMLFNANIKNIVKNSGKMLACMNIGIVGTVVGAIIAFVVVKEILPESIAFTGAAAASYIGGTANFVAVASSVGMTSDMVSVGAFSENFIMTLCIIFLIWVPTSKFFRKRYPSPYQTELEQETGSNNGAEMAAKFWNRKEMSLLDIAKTVATALVIVAVSNVVSGFFAEILAVGPDASVIEQFPGMLFGNLYVIMTLLAIILVAVFPKYFENLRGANELGTFVMYMYFAVIGCTVDLHSMAASIIPAIICYIIIGAFNIIINLIGGKITKQNIEEIAIASNACIGGPFTAMAMTASKGYSKLVVPALLAGIWGNTFGTIIGVALCGLFGIMA